MAITARVATRQHAVCAGVDERSRAPARDASEEIEGADVPRAGREATEHGVARPSRANGMLPRRGRAP